MLEVLEGFDPQNVTQAFIFSFQQLSKIAYESLRSIISCNQEVWSLCTLSSQIIMFICQLDVHVCTPIQAYDGKSGVYASALLKSEFGSMWSTNVGRWGKRLFGIGDKPEKSVEAATPASSAVDTESGPSDAANNADKTDDSKAAPVVHPGGDETSEWTRGTFLADKVMEVWALNHLVPLSEQSRGRFALNRILLASVPHAEDHVHVNHCIDRHATRAAWRTLSAILNEFLPSTLCEHPPRTPSLPEGKDGDKHPWDHFGEYNGGTSSHSLEDTEAAKEVGMSDC